MRFFSVLSLLLFVFSVSSGVFSHPECQCFFSIFLCSLHLHLELVFLVLEEFFPWEF
jgi:hypothetical protein